MGTRFPFTSYPRGWFVIGFSTDVEAGQVKTVRYFGRDLVLFRSEAGRIAALDPYCPHLGAHLGGGRVEGGCLRCPFHGWAFDGTGACVEVPYAPKIPPKARADAWEVREHNGVIQVWFDAAGEPPAWDPPVLEEEGWTEDRVIRWEVRTHPQEVAENTVDCAHLGPVHDVSRTEVRELEQDGPYMRVLLRLVARGTAIGMPEEINEVDLDVDLYGMGHLVAKADVITAGLGSRHRIHPTPIDDERIAIFGIVNTRAMADAEYTAEIAEIFYQAFVEDFARDFPIWENKAYLERPMLAAGDGPIGKYRRWARQFYDREERVVEREQPAGLLDRLLALFRGTPVPASGEAERASLKLVGSDGEAIAVARSEDVEVGRSPDAPRFPSVGAYFDSLEARFDPAAAGDLEAVFQWVLTGDDARSEYALVRGGQIQTVRGTHPAPTITITMSSDDYLLMINGDLNGARAFSTGRGKLRGPVRLAMKMQKLFPLEKAI